MNKYFTEGEKKMIVALYAAIGALLVWAFCQGCSYEIDVITEEVIIKNNGV